MDPVNTSFFEEIDKKDENTKHFLRGDIVTINEKTVTCTVWEKNITVDENHKYSRIDRYIFTQFHLKRKAAKNRLIKSLDSVYGNFITDLISLLVNLNVPLSKVENDHFKNFVKNTMA